MTDVLDDIRTLMARVEAAGYQPNYGQRFGMATEPCRRCPHQFRHHAVTEDGYRCRGCKCRRAHWR